MRTALVTGATGFIGSHLSRRLLAEGWNVEIVTRCGTDISILGDFPDRVTVHRHDGTTEGMSEIMDTARPDVVFHLASLFLSDHRAEQVEPLIRSNILFGTQLLEAMTNAGVRLLVNTGTGWQHFKHRHYDPVNLYAATKQAFEGILRYYVESRSVQSITLKLFDTYGPGDRRRKIFTLLREASGRNESLAMSPGEQQIDLVYIDDVLSAFADAAGRLLAGEVGGHESYVVTSGAPIVLRDLVDTYLRVTGRHVVVHWGGKPYRHREVMSPWNTGKPLPGWRPTVGLEEGIRRMESPGEGSRN
jgi:nucleoside-diphosphate-sugar epimerase